MAECEMPLRPLMSLQEFLQRFEPSEHIEILISCNIERPCATAHFRYIDLIERCAWLASTSLSPFNSAILDRRHHPSCEPLVCWPYSPSGNATRAICLG